MQMSRVTLHVKKAAHAAAIPLPRYMTPGASGMDICAALESPLRLKPGKRAAVPTGLHVAVPSGFELQVRPRSGLAARRGVTVLNSPGTIDADYRGEIKVIIINLGQHAFLIRPGDRIAQLVLCPVARAMLVEEEELQATDRSGGGFGHTGVASPHQAE